jgi:pimeloyl-ACP methyl ester carboxylesterase
MKQIQSFFFAARDAKALGAFRIALGIMLMVEASLVAPYLQELFGPHGFLDADLMRVISGPSLPGYAAKVEAVGIRYDYLVNAVYGLRWAGILAFTAGFFTLPATFIVWLTQIFFMASGSLSVYGLNRYFHVFLFLLLFMPAGGAYSWDAKKRGEAGPSWQAGFSLRVLQFSLLITYLNAGVSKGSGIDWYTGDSIWRVLNLPEFNRQPFFWLADYPWLPKMLGLATLFFETFYIAGVWIPWIGAIWLMVILGMHVGISLFLGLVNFGLGMALFNIALIAIPKAQDFLADEKARRCAIGSLGRLAPNLVAKIASWHFRSTQRYPLPAWEKELAREAERVVPGRGLVGFRWAGPAGAPTVLLIHGWSGRGTQMGAFVKPLQKAGFSVIALDAAGHGQSLGHSSDLGAYARSLKAAEDFAGPFHGIIAHSFGGVATAAALRLGLKVKQVVLIGVPCTITEIFSNYGALLGITGEAFRRFKALGEEKAGWRAEEMHVGRLFAEAGVPLLLIHDRGDKIVPLAQAQLTASAGKNARIRITEGLGHRRILKNEDVVRYAVEFFRGRSDT